jgi:hypothetical protein
MDLDKLNFILFFFRLFGFRCQIADDRSQMTENSLPLVFDSAELVAGCHLFSVLCPLYLPDT